MYRIDVLEKYWIAKLLQLDEVMEDLFEDKNLIGYRAIKGLQYVGIETPEETTPFELEQRIQALVESLEHQLAETQEHSPLELNVQALQSVLKLSDLECTLLEFALIMERKYLNAALDMFSTDFTMSLLQRVFAHIFSVSKHQLQPILNGKTALSTSGLFKVDTNGSYRMGSKLEVMNGLVDLMEQPIDNLLDLFSHLIMPAKPSTLDAEDFDHIQTDVALIQSYLESLKTQSQSGVNILLYGEPGVGKTELVRHLSNAVGVDLFEIAIMDKDGDSIRPAQRFSAYQLSQRLLAERSSHSCLLFDEVEDVFYKNEKYGKAWINDLLETNLVPAFWLTNKAYLIDPAFMRRFDLVIEIKAPTRQKRAQVLSQKLAGLDVSASWVAHMAKNDFIQPGHMAKAVRVVKHLNLQSTEAEQTMERILLSTQSALGHRVKADYQLAGDLSYNLNYLNTQVDLARMMTGLQRSNEARLCLFGPPGTGKSAFARYLAEQLDKPLVSKKASDLLDPYLGGTEQKIAQMFEEANREDAVLLLDEGDSFLRDRTGAQRSWEVTQVNELLTQMESFNGVFLISTNLMDNLDAAALRRFDFKLQFDYLQSDQAREMFMASRHHIQHDDASEVEHCAVKASQLSNLTPGDFAVIARKGKVMGGFEDAYEMLDALKSESRAKQPNSTQNPIGFIH